MARMTKRPASARPSRPVPPGGVPVRRRRRRRVALALALLVALALVAAALALLVPRCSGSARGAGGPGVRPGEPVSVTATGEGWRRVELDAGQDGEGVPAPADEGELREVLADHAGALGISDAYDELGPAEVSEVGGARYYRLPQRAGGIEVMGRSVTAATGGGNELVALSSNTVALDADELASEPSVGEDQVLEAATAAVEEASPGATDVLVAGLDDDSLVYYTFDVERPTLAWRAQACFAAADGTAGALELVVSAEDATVLRASSSVSTVGLPGVTSTVDVDVDGYTGDGTSTPLVSTLLGSADDGTQVYVLTPRTDAKWYDSKTKRQYSGYWWYRDSSGDRPFAREVMAGENSTASRQGVSAIDSLDPVLSYYDGTLGRDSYDDEGADIYLYTDVSRLASATSDPNDPEAGEAYDNNAAWWGYNECFLITSKGPGPDGRNTYATMPEVLAHEFTHAVVSHTCTLGDGDEQGALNEGFADVMGIAVRAHEQAGDVDAVDWDMDVVGRDAANPQGDALADWQGFLDRQAQAGSVECHDGATVLSHTAYLIWEDWVKYGDPSDLAYIDLIAKLFYQTLLLMPADATFAQTAASCVAAGEVMLSDGQITQTQFEAIERAFRTQGITPDGSRVVECAGDARLTVTDVNGHVYGNWAAQFTTTEATRAPASAEVVTERDGAVALTLDADDFEANATYTVTVSDRADSGAAPQSVAIRFTGTGGETRDLVIPTVFGTADVVPESVPRTDVEQDVVLVLDVSGSMAGEPLAALRDAVGQFLDVAEREGLSVGIVTFSSSATAVHGLTTSDYEGLRAALASDEFFSGGGTNVDEGLQAARTMLGEGSRDARTVVLMTDGMANEGRVGDELVSEAAELRSSGVSLYTLGFFNGLSGGELAEAQDLLERMATQGEHFEATGGNLDEFFVDIARQLQGQRYTYIRVACPVDVTVVCEGQVLSSSVPELASNADFGSISYMSVDSGGDGDGGGGWPSGDAPAGDNGGAEGDQVKLVRLVQGRDYEVRLEGTGEGEMDYSVSYMDETGAYADERSFEGVPLTEDTTILTSSAQTPETTLDVDEDGDGVTDVRWRAAAGERAERVSREDVAGARTALAGGAVVALVAVVGALEWRSRARRVAAGRPRGA